MGSNGWLITLKVPADDPLIGRLINNYTLVERLGKGAMGMVYKARHEMLERDAAIKLLAPQYIDDKEFVARFLREARAAAHLNHPNIVSVYDAGVDNDTYYLVMEYVDGKDLEHMLKERGVFPEVEMLRYGLAAAQALAYAHKHNIIHRDIKPENLMLTREGVLKVADLGLAKATNEQNASVTMEGILVGTPHYISPEQIRGEEADGRSDIYSLGATLFNLVTGRPPFTGSSSGEILSKHLSDPLPFPKQLNPKLSEVFCQVFFKMMFKDRNDRYANMDEVATALEKCLQACGQKVESRIADHSIPVDVSQAATEIAARPSTSRPVPPESSKLKLKLREPTPSAVTPVATPPTEVAPAAAPAPQGRGIELPPRHTPVERSRSNAFLDTFRGQNAWLRLPLWLACIYVGVYQFLDPNALPFLPWAHSWIHWAGHVLATPADAILRVSGGTIFQLAIPLVLLISFLRHRQYFALSVNLAWLGTILVSIGAYIADAKKMALAKTLFGDTPDGVHDWNFLLIHARLLDSCEKIGEWTRISGQALIILAIVGGVVVLGIMFRLRNSESPKAN
jgi:serine/threonine-protein kinase